jgi:hypothetical protein
VEPSELELYSTQELIEELMRRKTFLGVVVQCADAWKGGPWGDERIFRIHFSGHLDASQAGRLLDRVAEHLTLHSP